MARGRMIDKRISKSKKLAGLKHDRSRVLYFMILPHLDVEGKFTGDPEEIKEDCCPKLRYSVIKIAESIIELTDIGLLRLYEIDGHPFIQYTKFDDFQLGIRKDKEAPSRIPDPGRTKDEPTPSLYLSLKLSLRKEGRKEEKIHYDFETSKWKNITEKDMKLWAEAYPACDIKHELLAMADWLESNPEKKKSNYRAFISRWLKKQQDQGGSNKGKKSYQTRQEKEAEKIKDWTKKET